MCICKGIFIQLFYFCRVLNFVYETVPRAASLECVCSSVVVSVRDRECVHLSVIRLSYPPPSFSSSPPSLIVLLCWIRSSGDRKGYAALISIVLPFCFICLVKMGEVTRNSFVEVLFFAPVSRRHPGGKWRDGNCTLGYPEKREERTGLCLGLLSR